MIDEERIKRMCEKLEVAWKKQPDQRLFQYLFNEGFLERAERGRVLDPFHVEDADVEKRLDEILKQDIKPFKF